MLTEYKFINQRNVIKLLIFVLLFYLGIVYLMQNKLDNDSKIKNIKQERENVEQLLIENNSKRFGSNLRSFPSITVMKWPSNVTIDHAFIDKIISANRPVVLKNTPIEKRWSAFKNWNSSYLCDALGNKKLDNAWHSSRSTVWRWSSEYPWPSVDASYNSPEITCKVLMKRMESVSRYGWHYYSRSLEKIGKLDKDIIITDLLPSNYTGEKSLLWIGSAGVTSQCHIDHSHNFYVQVKGHKNFILVPPKAYETLRLFPVAHPLGRRSQILFESLQNDPETFEKLSTAGALEVTLQRGDILFIPCLWAHHVTNIDSGISVNVWSVAPHHEYVSLNTAIISKLTSSIADITSKNLNYSKIHLQQIFKHLDVDIMEWMKIHWTTRYSLLFETYIEGEEISQMEKYCSDTSSNSTITESDIEKLNEISKQVANNIQKMHPDIMVIHLGDYVDMLAYETAYPPYNVYFLKYCFQIASD